MKYYKNLPIIILLLCFFQCSYVFAQNNYSNTAIENYNKGAAFHNQGRYELAEQKYIETLKIQPDFTEAKKNLAILYPNLAYEYYSKADFEKSIYYAKKSLTLKPNNINSYNVLAQCYLALNDNEKAIENYNKIISINPNDTSTMHSIAQIYVKSRQYDKAMSVYKNILLIKPEDSIAKQNLNYTKTQQNERIVNESINNLKIEKIAPESLYRLIKPSAGITSGTVEKMKSILNLIWSEPNGQIMLQALLKNRTPINITQGSMTANATHSQKTNTFYLYGFIPIGSFTTNSSAVNIPFNYIANFNDPNLSSYQRIYSLHVFIHEFGHAFIRIKNPKIFNSIEEELGVSMIGYNVAYKIITGKYLDRAETEQYSKIVLQALLSDDHRNLPVFSGFNQSIQSYGVALPYPEVYSNIPLMYKNLLLDGKTTPVPSFNIYIK